MNIFYSDPNPILSAINLDDKRVIKMTLESAQLISNQLYRSIGIHPYRPTHINHPCSLALNDKQNFAWLIKHFYALCNEYTYRFNKIHKCQTVYNLIELLSYSNVETNNTSLPNCTPHKDMPILEAYRLTLIEKWKSDIRLPKWTNRARPMWSQKG